LFPEFAPRRYAPLTANSRHYLVCRGRRLGGGKPLKAPRTAAFEHLLAVA
jgi:hypothetical protein